MTMQNLEALRASVSGQVIAPTDPGYDDARKVYNFMIDRHPAGVVLCQTVDDVVAAVRYAAEAGLGIAVRGGSHSVPGFGTADDVLVADLSGLSQVHVDPSDRTARVGGGVTWGGFNDAGAAHGLATTGGVVSTTGVGGLTLGGGIGYLARAHGLSCDNLVAAQVVTADGQTLTASQAGDAGGYINFASDDDQSKVEANYGANYARLQEAKRQFDPDNLFRFNQNIKP